MSRIASDGSLLQPLPDVSPAVQYYRINKHLIVCDVADRSAVVLAVLHVSMDFPTRLAELQPTLSNEVELLHRQLHP